MSINEKVFQHVKWNAEGITRQILWIRSPFSFLKSSLYRLRAFLSHRVVINKIRFIETDKSPLKLSRFVWSFFVL